MPLSMVGCGQQGRASLQVQCPGDPDRSCPPACGRGAHSIGTEVLAAGWPAGPPGPRVRRGPRLGDCLSA